MRRLTLLVALAALAIPARSALAERDGALASRASAAAAGITRSTNTDWKLTWDDRTGAPTALFGSRSAPLAVGHGGPSAAARQFLLDHPDLFRLRPGQDDCRFDRSVERQGIRHFHMQQTYLGLPVFDAGYNVSLDELDRVVMVTGCAQPDLSGEVETVVAAALAERIARGVIPQGRLVAGRPAELALDSDSGGRRVVAIVRTRPEGGVEVTWATVATGLPVLWEHQVCAGVRAAGAAGLALDACSALEGL